MFVCHCQAVTDGTIRAAIKAGARSLSELGEQCGAGAGCGGCHAALWLLLAQTALEEGALPGRRPDEHAA